MPVELEPRHADTCLLLRRDTNGGPAASRASGLEHSDAPLVALLDSDDAWEPGKLAAQLEALERHPDAGLCFGTAVVVDDRDRETAERFTQVGAGAAPRRRDRAHAVLAQPDPHVEHGHAPKQPGCPAGGFDHPGDGRTWAAGCAWPPRARRSCSSPARGSATAATPAASRTTSAWARARPALAALDAHGDVLEERERHELRRDWLTLMARGEFRARRSPRGGARCARPRARRRWPCASACWAWWPRCPGARSALGRRDPHG